MVNINFVPDDYIKTGESRRMNLMYLVLVVIVMAALTSCFISIKVRQRACAEEEDILNQQMSQQQEDIMQVEQLQAKRNIMWKTALTTAELIEPVSRSVLLASLTNNLPDGVSLTEVTLLQKKPKPGNNHKAASATSGTKYDALKAAKTPGARAELSPEQQLETHIAIEGIAPSDIEVASYIEHLGNSALLDKVALIESKEYKDENKGFRKFRLTAMVRKTIKVSEQTINDISAKSNKYHEVY